MKSEKFYEDWKKQRSQIEVGHDVTDDVMNLVYQHEQLKREPLFDVQQSLEFIFVHPLAKAGLVAAGAVAGFIRVAFTVYVFLGT
jgi:hypothetical protein